MPLPALPDQPEELVAIARNWLVTLSANQEGIGQALNGAAALDALRNAHRKAGAGAEMEFAYAEAARTAERRLGELLTDGRTEGTVARGVGQASIDASTLADLSISRNLAADATSFARLTEGQWADLMATAREQSEGSRRAVLSRAAVNRACSDLLQATEDAADSADNAHQRMREENRRAEREIQALLAAVEAVAVEPVDDFVEIDVSNVPTDLAVASVVPADERREDPRWSAIRVDEAHEMILLANKLITRLDDLPRDADSPFAPLTITAAQDAAGRLINAVTRWAAAMADLQPEPNSHLRSI